MLNRSDSFLSKALLTQPLLDMHFFGFCSKTTVHWMAAKLKSPYYLKANMGLANADISSRTIFLLILKYLAMDSDFSKIADNC
jgi:hypothetical protein